MPDSLEVVKCELDQDEFQSAAVVRSEYCAASLRIDNHECVVKTGDWCDYCNNAAKDHRLLKHIMSLVQKLDHLAIAEEKMISVPGGMHKCIKKAQSHEYFDDGKTCKPPWLKPCLVTSDHWERVQLSTIEEDKEFLTRLTCTNRKNDAFVRICEYNVALLTSSSPDS